MPAVLLRYAPSNTDANAVSDAIPDHIGAHIGAEPEPERFTVVHGAVNVPDIVPDLADDHG